MTTLWMILVTIWLGVMTNAIYKLSQEVDALHFSIRKIVRAWQVKHNRVADGMFGENSMKWTRNRKGGADDD